MNTYLQWINFFGKMYNLIDIRVHINNYICNSQIYFDDIKLHSSGKIDNKCH